jgi:hypothetical protein
MEGSMAMSVAGAVRRHPDRAFFTGVALAIAAVVFVGFAPTYYLAAYFQGPALNRVRHVHGMLFSAWVLLFVAQALLVSARRTDVHRRLGWAGAALACAMLVAGPITAIDAARRGSAPAGIPPLAFMVVPMTDMLIFGVFVGAAVWYRRRADIHKRLMFLATIGILTAAIARLPYVLPLGPLAFFALTDLFIIAAVVHDRRSRGRVHPATLWGGAILVLSQPLRLAVAGTAAWLAFARMLVG